MSFAVLIARSLPTPEPFDPADPVANHPAAAIARRLNLILFPLLALVAAFQTILGPLTLPVWNRISRTRQRLVRLLGHLAAGRAPRIRIPGPDAAPRRSGARIPALPRRRGWLPAMLDYNVRGMAHHLNLLLHEPGVAETIAASPGAARTLRPLCQMLGVDLPEPLRPPARPPKPKPPKPPPPPEPAPPPMRPLPAYVQAAARAWRTPSETMAVRVLNRKRNKNYA